MEEAESYEAGPLNDQTRTVKIEFLIKTSNKNYTHSTSVRSDSLGRWFYNWDSHWSPNPVKPDVLGEFFFKNLTTGAVRFSSIVAFRRYQV